jgi:hypothetical protein
LSKLFFINLQNKKYYDTIVEIILFNDKNMTPEKQNTNPEDDAAKKLEKEAQEKKQLE